MQYNETVILKDGRACLLRNGVRGDGAAVLENFNATHAETDFMLSYPEENSFTAEQEGAFLEEKTASEREIEIVAFVDGAVAGTAGIESIGTKYKVRHRAELGIGILKAYWGLGVGSALMSACIECARQAGYTQIELEVVADNDRAIALYRKFGFEAFGRNPKGFNSKVSGWQPLILMRKELDT